jgi:hypothetical protein
MARYTANGAEVVSLDSASAGGALANPAYTTFPPVDSTVLASAARTTTQTGTDQTNNGYRGIKVVLDTTVNAGSAGSITLTIQGKDSASGKYYTLLAGAAVTTVTTNVYTVYPGLTASANVTANDVLPTTFRILVTANNANSVTYSVGQTLLV